MHYKTIVLELLHERYPVLHENLCRERKLPMTLHAYARELKTKHLAWMEQLRQTGPGSEPSQISSEGLELALEDLETALRQDFSTDESEPLSLDEAMAFITRHTLPV